MNWGQRITVTLATAAAGVGLAAAAAAPAQAAETQAPPNVQASCQYGEWAADDPVFWECQPTGEPPHGRFVIHVENMWDGYDRGSMDVSCQVAFPIGAPMIQTEACRYVS